MPEETVTEGTITVELEGKYQGWKASMREDPSYRFFKVCSTGDVTLILPELAKMIVGWNFKTFEGAPAEPIAEAIEAVPMAALNQLLSKYSEAFKTLPNR